jgi:hypothetical protein
MSYPRWRCTGSLLRMARPAAEKWGRPEREPGGRQARGIQIVSAEVFLVILFVLTFIQSEFDLFRGLSFPTISSAGPNAGWSCSDDLNAALSLTMRISHHSLFAGSKGLRNNHEGSGVHVSRSTLRL